MRPGCEVNKMQPAGNDFSVKEIMFYASLVATLVGPGWIENRVKMARGRQPPKDLSKHSHLYAPREHRLIQLFLDFERWREECLATGNFALREGVLKLAMLGKSIEATALQRGFERVVPRLKIDRQFQATAFEIEAAASYVGKGWAVEFVAEGTEKSPDLQVTRNDGSIFCVECKCRDEKTERDERISAIWMEVEKSVLAQIGPRKLNYAVVINAKLDPERNDVKILIDSIMSEIVTGEISVGSQRVITLGPGKKFEIHLHKFSEPDEEIESNGVGIAINRSPDRCVLSMEERRLDDGRTIVRNPKGIAFLSAVPPDRVTGILDALKAATKQLPSQGPGVVWIRIADNAWGYDLDRSFDRAKALLTEQLSGDRNRRVNAVILMTRRFERVNKGDLQGLKYVPLTIEIAHTNPRAAK